MTHTSAGTPSSDQDGESTRRCACIAWDPFTCADARDGRRICDDADPLPEDPCECGCHDAFYEDQALQDADDYAPTIAEENFVPYLG